MYVSNEYSATVQSSIVSCNIRRFVNAGYPRTTAHYALPGQDSPYKYLSLDLNDFEDMEFTKECLRSAVQFVASAIQHGEGCLVYCRGGSCRSGSVLVAYLMSTFKCSLREAYQHVGAVRPVAKPNEYQMSALVDLEIEFVGSSTLANSMESHMRLLTAHIRNVVNDKFGGRLVECVLKDQREFLLNKMVLSLATSDWSFWKLRKEEMESDEEGTQYKLLLHHINSDSWLELVRESVYLFLHSISKLFISELSDMLLSPTDKSIKLLSFVKKTILQIESLCGMSNGIQFAVYEGFSMLWSENDNIVLSWLSEYYHRMVISKGFEKLGQEKSQRIIQEILRVVRFARPNHHPIILKAFLVDYAERLWLDSPIDTLFLQQLRTSFPDVPFFKTFYEKMLSMKSDVALSANISSSFNSQHPTNFQFSASLLRSEHWLYEGNTLNCLLNLESAKVWVKFKEYFKDNFTNQSLTLLPHLGEAEIRYSIPPSTPISLIVSTLQMIILDLFNEADSLSLDDVIDNTSLSKETALQILKSLTHKPIEANGGILKFDEQTNLYSINKNFKSKTKRIRLTNQISKIKN
uniref:Tyrosine specific protein phosphatases domain-containing protein n=1 Tax=Arcella intermedia TaxID=1963864 RepID=A0A6B2L0N0_9EUKA